MLGITVTPTWKRKPGKAKTDVVPQDHPDTIAVAEEAIERIGVKVVLGTIVVIGSTIAIATLGRVIEAVVDNHLEKTK